MASAAAKISSHGIFCVDLTISAIQRLPSLQNQSFRFKMPSQNGDESKFQYRNLMHHSGANALANNEKAVFLANCSKTGENYRCFINGSFEQQALKHYGIAPAA